MPIKVSGGVATECYITQQLADNWASRPERYNIQVVQFLRKRVLSNRFYCCIEAKTFTDYKKVFIFPACLLTV